MPDVLELVQRGVDATNASDFDAVMSFFAPGAVVVATGMSTSFEGVAAIRGFFEEWIGSYDELAFEVLDIVDLGAGVVLTVNRLRGRLAGSSGEVRLRGGWIYEWTDARIARLTLYLNPDEARTAAERLTEERE
ncbi:MAG TPA: nuclear transport factor 2 family protein [Solirubrobacteraceae bacterium]|nr:nuclear transport factor 2 family protein [Solirubrobacteraceae bacterium]